MTLGSTGNLTIAGTLTQNSDRTTKTDIFGVEPDEVLAKVDSLPISTWRYKGDAADVHHLGPMAQDFAAAFGLGADDRHIAPLDAAGVGLAAIQALNRKVGEKQAVDRRAGPAQRRAREAAQPSRGAGGEARRRRIRSRFRCGGAGPAPPPPRSRRHESSSPPRRELQRRETLKAATSRRRRALARPERTPKNMQFVSGV